MHLTLDHLLDYSKIYLDKSFIIGYGTLKQNAPINYEQWSSHITELEQLLDSLELAHLPVMIVHETLDDIQHVAESLFPHEIGKESKRAQRVKGKKGRFYQLLYNLELRLQPKVEQKPINPAYTLFSTFDLSHDIQYIFWQKQKETKELIAHFLYTAFIEKGSPCLLTANKRVRRDLIQAYRNVDFIAVPKYTSKWKEAVHLGILLYTQDKDIIPTLLHDTFSSRIQKMDM